MLRLNVGIEAHTHEYIITSHIDSKFGIAFDSDECQKCLNLLAENPYLKFEGVHSHIGSQIFDLTAWYASIDKLVTYLKTFDQPLVLNIGGGFGIKYTEDDQPIPLAESLKLLIAYVEKAVTEQNVIISKLMIEPGRSIVGNAGSTLYTVGYQKQTPQKLYYFVDGGMSDNLRPSLYQAKYDCDIANKLDAPKTEKVTVAGKGCESGDILIEETLLPPAEIGDILVTYTTGAYGYSMSNQYNKNLVPAVVFVKDGVAREVIRRQTFENLMDYEVVEDES
jgi:diaminopimelate decarboxylase